MRKFYDALDDLRVIRSQVARGTQFRGYGPASIAGSGLLAIAVAAVETRVAFAHAPALWVFLATWIATASAAIAFTGVETIRRARREHGGFAKDMIQAAAGQFLPAIAAGVLLTGVLLRFAPGSTWMLPGLWQVLFSLGVFASCRFLPRGMFMVGAWYLSAGLVCLALGDGPAALSPWTMGIPFGIGQVLVAVLLQFGYRRHDA